eukprot:CAMPEP_0119331928 /NCGR_PEP_ID=MMETSP1333-20130426/81685_1 /TAXON_ID=418940 /ORGANISM="Scyphosphaera apsteinii, Strain RCC1455" /LENGTH=95 /DNA_ID=CAMNT_0007341645 /DNA_START=24 /DNA_END=307 /DNA_ORIENTATION=-
MLPLFVQADEEMPRCLVRDRHLSADVSVPPTNSVVGIVPCCLSSTKCYPRPAVHNIFTQRTIKLRAPSSVAQATKGPHRRKDGVRKGFWHSPSTA